MALDHMSIGLVEMKNYLRVEHNADDDLILLLIESAKEQAQAYLNHDFTETDVEGVVTQLAIPSNVKLACMKMVASWYQYRDDSTEVSSLGDRSQNLGTDVPWDAEKILFPYRRLAGL